MKVITTQPFNAMGIISAEAGKVFEVDETIAYQLEQMGFVEKMKTKKKKED